MPSASRVQHAIRLLALLHQAGEAADKPGDPPLVVLVVRSELRLQALDFWLRSPDYLADELVTEVEASRLDDSYLAVAFLAAERPGAGAVAPSDAPLAVRGVRAAE